MELRAPGRATTDRPSWLPLAVQLGAFVLVLGISDGALGVLWPSMRATFHLPLDGLGILTIAGTALYVVGGLVANRLTSHVGVSAATAASCGLGFLALLAWGLGPTWAVVLLGVAFLGLAKGVIDAVLNAEAALTAGVRRLGLLHGAWGVGGTIGPLLVAAALAWAHDWRPAILVTAAGALGITVLAVIEALQGDGSSIEQPATGESGAPASAPSGRRVAVARRSSWTVPLVLTVCAHAAYVAAEATPIAWGYTYLISDRQLSHGLAALAIALFWAALTGGRFVLAALNDRFPGTAILEVSCLCMVFGGALLWLLPGRLAIVGLPIAGLGAAAVFPVLVALTPARIGEAGTGHAVGLSIAASALGGPLAVALFGLLAAHLGVSVLGPCIFSAAVLCYAVNRLLTMATRQRGKPAPVGGAPV